MAFAECEKETEWDDTFVEFYDRRNEGIAVRGIIYGSVSSEKRGLYLRKLRISRLPLKNNLKFCSLVVLDSRDSGN